MSVPVVQRVLATRLHEVLDALRDLSWSRRAAAIASWTTVEAEIAAFLADPERRCKHCATKIPADRDGFNGYCDPGCASDDRPGYFRGGF